VVLRPALSVCHSRRLSALVYDAGTAVVVEVVTQSEGFASCGARTPVPCTKFACTTCSTYCCRCTAVTQTCCYLRPLRLASGARMSRLRTINTAEHQTTRFHHTFLCTLALTYSNGQTHIASTAPAMHPEVRETTGFELFCGMAAPASGYLRGKSRIYMQHAYEIGEVRGLGRERGMAQEASRRWLATSKQRLRSSGCSKLPTPTSWACRWLSAPVKAHTPHSRNSRVRTFQKHRTFLR